jgi:hypothetical protein
MKSAYLHCEKYKGKYKPYELSDNLDDIYSTYEYGDVAEGEYQIWEYPSGKIFQIKPDREVEDKYYYSSPDKIIWWPVLHLLELDVERVTEAYRKLSSK